MSTGTNYVRDQVSNHLAVNWKPTPIVGEENIADQPPADLSPWLAYSVQPTQVNVRGLGTRCRRETGILMIEIWTSSGSGDSAGVEYAEMARTMFDDLILGRIRFLRSSPPEPATRDAVDASRGNWFGHQITIPYEYDYLEQQR